MQGEQSIRKEFYRQLSPLMAELGFKKKKGNAFHLMQDDGFKAIEFHPVTYQHFGTRMIFGVRFTAIERLRDLALKETTPPGWTGSALERFFKDREWDCTAKVSWNKLVGRHEVDHEDIVTIEDVTRACDAWVKRYHETHDTVDRYFSSLDAFCEIYETQNSLLPLLNGGYSAATARAGFATIFVVRGPKAAREYAKTLDRATLESNRQEYEIILRTAGLRLD